MKVESIIGYAKKDGIIKWIFKLTWGDGHGGMWAIPADIKQDIMEVGSIFRHREASRIELQDYDITINLKDKMDLGCPRLPAHSEIVKSNCPGILSVISENGIWCNECGKDIRDIVK